MNSMIQPDFNSQLRDVIWRGMALGAMFIFVMFCESVWAQSTPPTAATAPHISARPAADLYLRLGRVGLDAKQVYSIRDGALDVEDIHIGFNDGTIAFTEAVDGHVTGALFVGEGEILVVPPSQVERQSMQQFTGAAVLSEQFRVAYLRFPDASMMEKLRPAMRAASEAAEFIEAHNDVARNLAVQDALRLLITMTRDPGVAGAQKHFLRARISGEKLGVFDVLFDPSTSEQVAIGQLKQTEYGAFYDQWCLFPMRSVRNGTGKHMSSMSENASFDSSGQAEAAPGEASGIHILSYKIKAVVRPPTELSAESELEITVNSGGDRTLAFELSRNLKISEVQEINDQNHGSTQPLEFIQNDAVEGSQLARRGNDLVAVVLPRTLKDGQSLRLRFTYQGQVMSEAGGGLVFVGARGVWYPNRGISMANFDMEFRSPEGWKLLATGQRISSQLNPDTKEETTRWKSDGIIPLAGFNLGRYEMTTITPHALSTNGTPPLVEVYATLGMENSFRPKQTETLIEKQNPISKKPLPDVMVSTAQPPKPASHGQDIADQAAHSIDFLAEKFGPFPFPSLSITQMPGADSQGFPELIYLSSYAYLSDNERPYVRGFNTAVTNILYDRVMTAHEISHQWWGDAVTSKSYRDSWLMEAISQYFALMMLEREHPEELQKVMEFYREDLMKVVHDVPVHEAGPVTLGTRLFSSKYPASYDDIIYGRGAWLIHMLRMMLQENAPTPMNISGQERDPDTLFLGVLRDLQVRYRGKTLSVSEFQRALEAVLPKPLRYEDVASLDWFFQGWVEGTALPSISLKNVKVVAAANMKATSKHIATATLVQENAPEQLVSNVPIYAVNGAGLLTYVGRFFADGTETDITATVPVDTKRLVVDPYRTVLTRP